MVLKLFFGKAEKRKRKDSLVLRSQTQDCESCRFCTCVIKF
jgi:hypothetical protein